MARKTIRPSSKGGPAQLYLDLVEIWKLVPAFEEFYEVSSWGRVRSLERYVPAVCGARSLRLGRVLKPLKTPNGYLQVALSVGYVRTVKLVHRLVLEAFVGPCPPRCQACHQDNDRLNNRIVNLRWDTASANGLDKRRHGTALVGERNPASRLTDQHVAILKDMGSLFPAWQWAETMGVHQTTISRVLRGER